MERKNNIKWACIQPLTGGMYLGTADAIGHDAEWILSYDGLDFVKYEKDGSEIKNAGNEYNLLQYLMKHNRNVPYYKICNRDMFDTNTISTDVEIRKDEILETPDYTDIDLIVSVPVCSGLSMATNASQATKNSRNCNMEWLAYYVMNVIKPKVYCFENAPTLISSRGDYIRTALEEMAKNFGYSVLYYKTDTVLHNNCQRRPRTFVVFFKWTKGHPQLPPQFEFESKTIQIPEFFNKISKDAPQQTPVKSYSHNYMMLDFYNYKFGENWPTKMWSNFNLLYKLYDEHLVGEFIEFIKNGNYTDEDKKKAIKYLNHMLEKRNKGMNYFGQDACLFTDLFPSVQFRSIPNMLHYTGKRFCTIREYLSLMGMPEDFILYGGEKCREKIGQNVPVNTAKFIVEQILNYLTNNNYINENELSEQNVIIQDNTKQEVIIK